MAKLLWSRFPIGSATWYRLRVDGCESPFFISKDKYDRGPSGEPYQLLGSGMSPGGSAACFGHFERIAEAKAKAEQLSCIGAADVERVEVGNRVFIVGDRVTTTKTPDGFFFTPRRFGELTRMVSAGMCWVKWTDEPEPSPHWLPLLVTTVELAG